MAKELTVKQQLFAIEYIKCLNATEAARNAGYSGDSNALAVTGHETLRNPKVTAEIDRILNEYTMSAAEVLMHLTDIARADIGDVLDGKGNLDLEQARTLKKTRLIKKIKNRAITTEESDINETEVEMYDRLTALGMLAKYHNLTNHVKVDDWRTEIIQLLKNGKITPEQVRQELGYDIAQELFKSIGLSVTIGGEGEST